MKVTPVSESVYRLTVKDGGVVRTPVSFLVQGSDGAIEALSAIEFSGRYLPAGVLLTAASESQPRLIEERFLESERQRAAVAPTVPPVAIRSRR